MHIHRTNILKIVAFKQTIRKIFKYSSGLFLFLAPKKLSSGQEENKEKHLFYFDLGICLPIQIQWLDI
jgi:hypothetical protein